MRVPRRFFEVLHRLLNVSLSILLVTSSVYIPVLVEPEAAFAAPSLSVSKTVSKPLLGGQATVHISVTNTGDVKGYNLTIRDDMYSDHSPTRTVTVISATDGNGSQPTSQTLNAGTGHRLVDFIDIKDLAPTETYSMDIVVDISGDNRWEVGDLLKDDVSATVAQFPDGSGAQYSGSASAQADVIPVKLTKTVQQSTSILQATGVVDRPYTYTLQVQNNYTNPTKSVVVTDTIPDGVEYLGVQSGPAPDGGFPQRDPVTGVTTLQWTLGTMAPAQLTTIVFKAGIRYDYYGTADGGNNRLYSAATTPGVPIPEKTSLTNVSKLSAAYKGSLPATLSVNTSSTASVSAAYITLDKSGTPTAVGYGTTVHFTLVYSASEYYHSDGLGLYDRLPDGLTLTTPTVSPAPTSVVHNADGTTDIHWSSAVLAALPHSANATVTLDATVDTNWEAAALAGQPIRAGDSFTNYSEIGATWHDQLSSRTQTEVVVNNATVVMQTGLPEISKQVFDAGTSTWTQTTSATVGDKLLFRVRFNKDDAGPIRNDITMGNTALTDWLPAGLAYDNDAVVSRSASATFSQPTTTSPVLNLDVPQMVSLGGLTGVQWYLGDVGAGGWWEATFTATVQDIPAVQNAVVAKNYWKLTGIDTGQNQYSRRDAVTVNYTEPQMTLTKSVVAAPNPVAGGSTIGYRITVNNAGTTPARNVSVIDTLPVGMRQTAPTVTSVKLDGVPLASNVGYKVNPVWNPAGGVLAIDLEDTSAPAVHTVIPPGSTLTADYNAVVDQGLGAGASLVNTASVSYSSQDATGGRDVPVTNNPADPNTKTSSLTLAPLRESKTATPAGPIRIGDTESYEITVTVPRGEKAYWPRVVDTFDHFGETYVPGSAQLIDLAGAPPVPAAFSGTPTPTISSAGQSRIFSWQLATIDNSGTPSDYTFKLRYSVVVTALQADGTTWDLAYGAVPQTTMSLNNTAAVGWAWTDRGAGSTDQTVTASKAVTVGQSVVVGTKSVVTPGPYHGGQAIAYTSTITNTGAMPAYRVTWADILPSPMSSATVSSITKNGVPLVGGSDYTASFAAARLDVSFATSIAVAPSDVVTVAFVASTIPTVGAGAFLTNNVDINWASMPATVTGERRYDETSPQEANNQDDPSLTLQLAPATVVKSIISTPNPTVGDTVTYNLRVTVPTETVLYTPSIIDTIGTDGLHYVPGSAFVADVSGSAVTSAALFGIPVESVPPTGAGTVVFNLGPLVSNASSASPAGDSPYVFDLQFKMLVTALDDSGVATFPPSADRASTDTGTVSWSDGVAAHTVSSTALTTIKQPSLKVTKTFSANLVPASGLITATVTVQNVGHAPAYPYDLGASLVDTLPAELTGPQIVTATSSAFGALAAGSDFTTALAGSQLRVTYLSNKMVMQPNDTLTFVYRMSLDPAAGAGRKLTNSADANWTSLPAGYASRRVYDDGWAQEGTSDTTSATTFAPQASLKKRLTISSVTTHTIGDVFSYDVTMGVPAGTTLYSAVATDAIPDGLSVLSTSTTLGAASAGARTATGTLVTWNLGTVSNSTASTMTATMTVTVSMVTSYAVGVNGPTGTVPPGQTVLGNTARLAWQDAPAGGSTWATTTPVVNVTTVEPRLRVLKSVVGTSAGPGDVLSYTVGIGNTGTSRAWQMWFRDVLPAQLSTLTLTGVSNNGTPLVGGVDYFAALGSQAATLTFANGVSIAQGTTLTITYTAVAKSGMPKGQQLPNNAQVPAWNSQPVGSPQPGRSYSVTSSVATVTALAGALVTTKTRVPAKATAQRGNTVRWRFAVADVGDAPVMAVSVVDTLPAGLGYVPGSAVATWGVSTSTVDPIVSGGPGGTTILVWPAAFWSAIVLKGQTLAVSYDTTVALDATYGAAPNTAYATANDMLGVPIAADLSASNPSDTDKNDTATASVLITDPRVSVTKALALSQDTTVQAGQTVTYRITVTDSGTTSTSVLPLTDQFDATRLAYTSASIAPSSAVGGLLTWNNLGVVLPTGSVVVTVTLTALSSPPGFLSSNTATVAGASDVFGDSIPTTSSAASVAISRPLLSISKVLHGGQAASVPLGSDVAYDLVVTNSGNTTLSSVPASDTFDSARLKYVYAVPAEDTSAAASLRWNSVGALAPGQVTTVTVHFTADNTGTAVVNDAFTSGTDLWGDPAPATSTVNSVMTLTAPHLTIAKSASVASAGAADVVTYTVTIGNDGSSPAYNVMWQDTPAAALVGPQLVSATIGGVPAIPGVDFLYDFSTSPLTAHFLTPLPVGAASAVLTYKLHVPGGIVKGQLLTNSAKVLSYDTLPAGGKTLVGGTAGTTVTGKAPALVTVKTRVGKATAQRGDTVTWRYVVTNVGDAAANSVSITDTPPSGFAYVTGSSSATWTGGLSTADPSGGAVLSWPTTATLVPGGTYTLTFATQVTAGAPFALATNAAHAAALDASGAPVPADASASNAADTDKTDSSAATVLVTNPTVGITKTLVASQDTTVQPGQTVSYRIVVTNSGDTTTQVLPLTDTFDAAYLTFATATPAANSTAPAGTVTWNNLGAVAPLASRVVTVTLTAIAAPGALLTSDIASVAAAARDVNGDPIPPVAASAAVAISTPGVSIVKQLSTGQPASVPLGGDVAYDLVVRNIGDTTLASVPVTDTFDTAHLAYTSAFPAEDASGGATVRWTNVGPLAPGQVTTVTAHFSVIATGTAIPNAGRTSGVDLWGDPAPSAVSTNSVLVGTAPHLTIAKSASRASAGAADEITYTVTIVNDGDSAAYDTLWRDTPDAPLFGGAGPMLLSATVGGVPAAYLADFSTSPLSLTLLTPIPAGSSAVLTYVSHVAGGVLRGQAMTNTAEVRWYETLPTGGRTLAGPSAGATVTARAPALVTAKTATGDTFVQHGEQTDWAFTVTNVGDAPAYGVSAADTLPAGFAYVAGSASLTWPSGSSAADPSGGSGPILGWMTGAVLQPGETLTIAYRAAVTTGAPFGTATNTGAAAATDASGAPVPADASGSDPADTDKTDAATATVVVTDPHVSVTKALAPSQDATVQAGQTVTFRIVVTNDGDTTMPAVPLTDTFDPAVLAFSAATPAPASTGAGSATWAFGALSPGASKVVTVTLDAVAPPAGLRTADLAAVTGAVDVHGDPVPDASATASVAVSQPRVSIAKLLYPGQSASVPIGGTVVYDLVVENSGDTTISSLPLKDSVDTAHLTFVDASPAEDSSAGSWVTWSDIAASAPLAPGAVTTVTATFRATSTTATVVDNRGDVQAGLDENGDPVAPVSSDNTDLAITSPHLTIAKSVTPTNAAAADTVTYTVTIANEGDSAAHDTMWQDTPDAGMFGAGPVVLTGADVAGLPAAYVADFSTAPMTLHFLTPIPAGSSAVITYVLRVPGGLSRGLVMANTARVLTYGSLPGGAGITLNGGSATADVVGRAPALVTAKSRVSKVTTQRGSTVTWRYTVTNTGDASAFGVGVSDLLPPGLTYAAGSASATWPTGLSTAEPFGAPGPALSWATTATLAPGETYTLTFDTLVSAAAPFGLATNRAAAVAVDASGAPVPADPAGTNPADTDLTDSSSAAVLVTNPHVSIAKTLATGQDAAVQAGQAVTFRILVINDGDTTAAVLPMRDTYDPAALAFSGAIPAQDTTATGSVGWNDVGPLAPGASAVVTATFSAVAPPVGLATTDAAAVRGGTDVNGDPIPDVSATAGVAVTHPAVSVTKRLAGGQAASVPQGGLVRYDLVVLNSGDTTLTSIGLGDAFDASRLVFAGADPSADGTAAGNVGWNDLASSFGPLAPGRSATVTVTFSAVATGAAVADAASVTATDADGDPAPPVTDPNGQLTITAPRLILVKTASQAAARAGEDVTYTVTVHNPGDSAAYDTLVVDHVDAALFTAGSSPSLLGVSLAGSPLVGGVDYVADFGTTATSTLAMLAPIPAGETLTLTYKARVAGGVVRGRPMPNVAQVASYDTLPVGGETFAGTSDSATVTAEAPALVSAKAVVGDAIVQRGENVTWRYTVRNVGDAPAFGVSLTDTLPVGFSYQPGSSRVAWPGGVRTAEPILGAALHWTPAAILQPGETLTLTYASRVSSVAPFGTATNAANAASVDGGGAAVPKDASASDPGDVDPTDSGTASVLVTNPHVIVTKALAARQDPAVQAGRSVTFRITVTNDGDTTAAVLPLTDTFDPAALAFASARPSADVTSAGTVGWKNVGPLGPRASVVVTATFTAVAPPARLFTRDVAAIGRAVDVNGDRFPVTSGQAAVAVTHPALTVSKRLAAGQPSSVRLGGLVTYDITLTNSGDTTLTTLPLTDAFGRQLAFVGASPAANGTQAVPGGVRVRWRDLLGGSRAFAPRARFTAHATFRVVGASRSVVDTASVGPARPVDVFGDPAVSGIATASVATYDPGAFRFGKTAVPPAGTIVLPGSRITYTLSFSNGTSVTIPAATLHDALPPSVSYVAGSMVLSLRSTKTKLTDAVDADAGRFASGPRSLELKLGDLPADATGTLTFAVTVGPENLSRRGVLNVARMASGGATLAVSPEVYHPVDPISITKVGRDVNGGALQAGDAIEWTITVTNTGLSPTTHVVIRDTVPAHTVYVPRSIAGPGYDDTHVPQLSWDLGTMPVGAKTVVKFRSTVLAFLPKGTVIRNQASVSSAQSRTKYSDDPMTPKPGDATLLRTGFDERGSLAWAFWLALLGCLFVGLGLMRRRRFA